MRCGSHLSRRLSGCPKAAVGVGAAVAELFTNSEPTPAPVADDSGLPLETEPLLFFHPTLAGLAPPGAIQPFPGPVPLDEEPAVWLQFEEGGQASRRDRAVREGPGRS